MMKNHEKHASHQNHENDGKLEVMEIMNTNSKNHQKGNIMTNACANVLCEVIARGELRGANPPPTAKPGQRLEHWFSSAALDLAMW